MAMRLLVVRHAETDWNRERRYQGWSDRPLSPAGLAQADAVASALTETPLGAVYASPLRRATETAAAIAARHGRAVIPHGAFKEMGFGRWEGLTAEQARAVEPALYQTWLDAPHLVTAPGGESLVAVRARVLRGLEELRGAHGGEAVCVVTHAIAARILILEALSLDLERIWSLHVSTTGISELEFRPDWTAVHRVNTRSHLDAVAAAR
jgi:probable phosphoglycerate mutase